MIKHRHPMNPARIDAIVSSSFNLHIGPTLGGPPLEPEQARRLATKTRIHLCQLLADIDGSDLYGREICLKAVSFLEAEEDRCEERGAPKDQGPHRRMKELHARWNIKTIVDDLFREILEDVEGDLVLFDARLGDLPDYVSHLLDKLRSEGMTGLLDEAWLEEQIDLYIGRIPDLQVYLRENLPDCTVRPASSDAAPRTSR